MERGRDLRQPCTLTSTGSSSRVPYDLTVSRDACPSALCHDTWRFLPLGCLLCAKGRLQGAPRDVAAFLLTADLGLLFSLISRSPEAVEELSGWTDGRIHSLLIFHCPLTTSASCQGCSRPFLSFFVFFSY